jgi:DNA-binding CsgD family transcriptional regulator
VSALPFSPAGAAEPAGRSGGWIPFFLTKENRSKERAVEKNVRLTERETEVLGLIARGCTYAQAARQLGTSAHTVGTHVKNAYRKLDVHSAPAAVMRAIELQLLQF